MRLQVWTYPTPYIHPFMCIHIHIYPRNSRCFKRKLILISDANTRRTKNANLISFLIAPCLVVYRRRALRGQGVPPPHPSLQPFSGYKVNSLPSDQLPVRVCSCARDIQTVWEECFYFSREHSDHSDEPFSLRHLPKKNSHFERYHSPITNLDALFL